MKNKYYRIVAFAIEINAFKDKENFEYSIVSIIQYRNIAQNSAHSELLSESSETMYPYLRETGIG